jgi:MFS family permease
VRPLVPALLREPAFRRYWTGQSVSLIGDQISLIALPLAAVYVLHADAAEMGWLKTAELLPALLFSLPAGAWADRMARRRRTMILTDLARAALLATLPLAYAFDLLTLAQLYVVAFAVGALTVLFDVCNVALFAALIPSERYVEANSLVNGSRALSFVAGPSAGGLLVQLLTAPLALLADACTFLASAGCLTRIAPPEPPPATAEKGHLLAGLRWVGHNPSMRALLAAGGTTQFFNFVFHTLFVLYATTALHLSAGAIGTTLGIGAVGGLVGAGCMGAVVRRCGVGPSIVIGFAVFSAPLMLVPLAAGPTWLLLCLLGAAEFLSCVGVMLVDIASGSLQIALMPPSMRSRIKGAFRMLNHGFRPLGALAGGLLGSTLGMRPALWIGTAGAVLALLWLLPSPVPGTRTLPEPPRTDGDDLPAAVDVQGVS